MEPTTILLLCILAGMSAGIFLLYKKLTLLQQSQIKEEDTTLMEWLKLTQDDQKNLQKSLHEFQQTVADRLTNSQQVITSSMQQNTKDIHDRLSKAAEVIGNLQREAGAFTEVSRSMKELQEFLKSPKLRGNIGESVLNDLVSQMFPKESFHIQYKFRTGDSVDLALKTDAGVIPIDAKFPMESFERMMAAKSDAEREKLTK
jgi:DNA recombination protein RmuC